MIELYERVKLSELGINNCLHKIYMQKFLKKLKNLFYNFFSIFALISYKTFEFFATCAQQASKKFFFMQKKMKELVSTWGKTIFGSFF